jgi:hypothetical protein
MKRIQIFLILIFFTACNNKPDYSNWQIMTFTPDKASSINYDTVSVYHLESDFSDFTFFDTIRGVEGVAELINDSQLVSKSMQFSKYHKLLFVSDDYVAESNVFQQSAQNSNYNIKLVNGKVRVVNTGSLPSRYRDFDLVLFAVGLAIIIEILLLLIFFLGMRINAALSLHSLWMNVVAVPVILWVIVRYVEYGFPLSLAVLTGVIILKALFMYYASHTIRSYRRFFVISAFTNSISYLSAWLSYYILVFI